MTKLKGKAQTVLGLVDSSELGITLPHEHIFTDLSSGMIEPMDPLEKELAYRKVTLENLWFARHYKMSCKDNMILDDEDLAIREAAYFKEAGGKTITDVSVIGIGRNPKGLVKVAKTVGINIIMGTGYYISPSFTPEMRLDLKTDEEIAEGLIREITVGVGNTGIKAGVIGEIGTSWPLETRERKSLRAAGMAQQETGAAIYIHPGCHVDAPFEYVKVLEEVKADLSRVIFGHMHRTFPMCDRKARVRLAEKGSYLAFDAFGFEGIYPSPAPPECPYDVPNDAMQITEIMEHIEDGLLNQILISQDVCYKVCLRAYGGGGYSHILKIIVPKMRRKGMTEEQIKTILVENPKRILAFA